MYQAPVLLQKVDHIESMELIFFSTTHLKIVSFEKMGPACSYLKKLAMKIFCFTSVAVLGQTAV